VPATPLPQTALPLPLLPVPVTFVAFRFGVGLVRVRFPIIYVAGCASQRNKMGKKNKANNKCGVGLPFGSNKMDVRHIYAVPLTMPMRYKKLDAG